MSKTFKTLLVASTLVLGFQVSTASAGWIPLWTAYSEIGQSPAAKQGKCHRFAVSDASFGRLWYVTATWYGRVVSGSITSNDLRKTDYKRNTESFQNALSFHTAANYTER